MASSSCPECDDRAAAEADVCLACGRRAGSSSSSNRIADTWNRVREGLTSRLADLRDQSLNQLPGGVAFLQSQDLRQWLDAVYEGTRTQYDRAMDAAFIAKQRAGELDYAAGQHRLFDEGHTLWGSFDRAQQAVQGDSDLTEIVEWSRSYMKDLATPSGMPLVDVAPSDYEAWASAFSRAVPGLEERYLFDLLNVDAMELIAVELGVVGVVFSLTDEDLSRLSEIIGAMGLNAVVAANPILGMITIATTAYAYWRHEKIAGSEAIKGGAIAAVSSLIFLTLGLPVLVELVVALVVGYQVRERIFENTEFVEWLNQRLRDHSTDLDDLASVLPDTGLKHRLGAYLDAG